MVKMTICWDLTLCLCHWKNVFSPRLTSLLSVYCYIYMSSLCSRKSNLQYYQPRGFSWMMWQMKAIICFAPVWNIIQFMLKAISHWSSESQQWKMFPSVGFLLPSVPREKQKGKWISPSWLCIFCIFSHKFFLISHISASCVSAFIDFLTQSWCSFITLSS